VVEDGVKEEEVSVPFKAEEVNKGSRRVDHHLDTGKDGDHPLVSRCEAAARCAGTIKVAIIVNLRWDEEEACKDHLRAEACSKDHRIWEEAYSKDHRTWEEGLSNHLEAVGCSDRHKVKEEAWEEEHSEVTANLLAADRECSKVDEVRLLGNKVGDVEISSNNMLQNQWHKDHSNNSKDHSSNSRDHSNNNSSKGKEADEAWVVAGVAVVVAWDVVEVHLHDKDILVES